MDMRYVAYCYADRHFYDIPQNSTMNSRGAQRFQLPARDWGAWSVYVAEGWTYVMPDGAELPDQGWKIHVSASFENAQYLLNMVAEYCGGRRVAFKYLPTTGDLVRANTKYADRGSSGKFITLYPLTPDECETTLKELDMLIGGQDGPYILSDLRYNDGPLYVRYGGFRPRFIRGEGDPRVPAIMNESGELVPDERLPTFTPPSWVSLPAFVVEQVVRLGGNERPDRFRYDISEALHFSNGGGIYKAESLDRSNSIVVLKEGRPFAGVSPDGRSAIDRLQREAAFLKELADLDAVVDYVDYFEEAGHHFLVEELVEGVTLNKQIVLKNPLIRSDSSRADRLEYRDWALGILKQVEDSVHEFHSRGIVFGDLHPNNIIVTEAGQVRFIDFEMAYRVDDRDVVPAGAPGFMAEDGRIGISADLYSLGCMKLGLFIPLTVLLPLDTTKIHGLVDHARRNFELDEEFCTSILADIGLRAERGVSAGAQRVRDRAAAWRIEEPDSTVAMLDDIETGIWNHLDLSRVDRAFPGDIAQFSEGGYGIAHGAAGVLLTLRGEHPWRERVLDWIEDAVRNATQPTFGFFDGSAGAAHALRRLGRPEAALEIEARLEELPLEELTSDYFSGLAGIGIHFMDEASRGVANTDEVCARIRGIMASRADESHASMIRLVNGVPTATVGKGGLMRGLSGQALYWVRSFEYTSDRADLDRAERLLREDCSLLVPCEDGSIQLNEGWRVLPYLATGALGVGLVIARFLQHQEVPEFRELLRGIAVNVEPSFSIQSNLFNGRASFIHYVQQGLGSELAIPNPEEQLLRQVGLLSTHVLVHRDGIHFPGEQLMRMACDWATGSAGVLSVLRRFAALVHGVDDPNYRLPFPGLELDPIGSKNSLQDLRDRKEEPIVFEKGGEPHVLSA